MMFRSGWSRKPGQEVILAVWLKRPAFDEILSQAVHSTYNQELYGTIDRWKPLVKSSSVLLQWDPDHDPSGAKVERRAIQLGMRGAVLAHYARDWIMEVEDISTFVHQQYLHVSTQQYERLMTPREIIYPITDIQLAVKLGISSLA